MTGQCEACGPVFFSPARGARCQVCGRPIDWSAGKVLAADLADVVGQIRTAIEGADGAGKVSK